MDSTKQTGEVQTDDKNRYWRILIKANSDFDIQGVNLRDAICNEIKFAGQVSNRKDGRVEVIVYCDKQKADAIAKQITKIGEKRQISGYAVEDPSDTVFDFNRVESKMEIVRSDDLREMVWGLQGAGKVFQKQVEQKKQNCLTSIAHIFGHVIESEISGSDIQFDDYNVMLRDILKESPFDEPLTGWLFVLYEKMSDRNNEEVFKIIKQLEKNSSKAEEIGGDYQELYYRMKKRVTNPKMD